MRNLSNKLIQKELQRRGDKHAPDFLAGAFPHQQDLILDPARQKAAFCTRRAAKSYTGGLYLFKEAFENQGCTVLYIALTRDSAKKIMWKDILKPLSRKFKLKCKFNETALTCTLPNGSIIYLMGVDSSEDEKDKLLGQKYRLAIIDECASYTIDLRELVYGTLKPAMADLAGTIVMLGTPGNLVKSLFFDITNGLEPGWSMHKWTTFDNPYMADKWRKEIEELTTLQPYIIDTPMFKQMYLGQWVIDSDALVYKFSEERNIYRQLPLYPNGDWQYLLGVDLGYEDDSAFVVAAFHEHDKNLYLVDTYKAKRMDITDVANKIKELKARYNIHKVTIDGANKQAVEEIQKRHHIPLIAADKTGKSDFIEIMNAELIMGRIKVEPKNARELIEEWQGLVWKEKGIKREENPSCDNHLADAALYAWRFAYQYLSEMPAKKPVYGTKAWMDAEVERMEEEALEYFTKQEESVDPFYEE